MKAKIYCLISGIVFFAACAFAGPNACISSFDELLKSGSTAAKEPMADGAVKIILSSRYNEVQDKHVEAFQKLVTFAARSGHPDLNKSLYALKLLELTKIFFKITSISDALAIAKVMHVQAASFEIGSSVKLKSMDGAGYLRYLHQMVEHEFTKNNIDNDSPIDFALIMLKLSFDGALEQQSVDQVMNHLKSVLPPNTKWIPASAKAINTNMREARAAIENAKNLNREESPR